MGQDKMEWDGMWAGMGQDGMGQDGMGDAGWDMGWDGTGTG